ncbi:unnamed protein product, partial [Larinioides sclopetarius]
MQRAVPGYREGFPMSKYDNCVLTCPLRQKWASSLYRMFYGQVTSTTIRARNCSTKCYELPG